MRPDLLSGRPSFESEKVVVLVLEPICCHYMVVLTRKYVYRRKLLVVQWLYNGCYWLYNGKATDSLPWQPRNSEIAKYMGTTTTTINSQNY